MNDNNDNNQYDPIGEVLDEHDWKGEAMSRRIECASLISDRGRMRGQLDNAELDMGKLRVTNEALQDQCEQELAARIGAFSERDTAKEELGRHKENARVLGITVSKQQDDLAALRQEVRGLTRANEYLQELMEDMDMAVSPEDTQAEQLELPVGTIDPEFIVYYPDENERPIVITCLSELENIRGLDLDTTLLDDVAADHAIVYEIAQQFYPHTTTVWTTEPNLDS